MSKVTKQFSIQSYIDKNRNSLDESLVSLRIMKEIDKILDSKNLSNRELAIELGYSESYISQLMTGVKNVNVSFISKFEKAFAAKFDFRIFLKDDEILRQKIREQIFWSFDDHLTMFISNDDSHGFSFRQGSKSMMNVTDIEYETLK
ncbi:helix-turn-helix protein [Anseongella ginsenosidimutans]|uniref:Helix-turn-helix protein n=1 Tax=Anseongella ginsenosidimutans TaxID=496056 RepID=A0A4R3KR14_9SPHI|nr:helix-turn-helix transcriptional regulator [Anseongella ginsenosidimutans]QEC52156.1 helix-turn-helix transcriptional regulator [Anseongella ginsenosidimutans]TCS86695.1 helix-turn-helix protein [Anseongella ginsenosidimutans]